MLKPPSPIDHPAAYGSGLTATTTALIVYECNTRLGFNISELEAGWLVAIVTAGYLAAFGKKKA
jgi:hypothetical protein